MDSSSGFGIPLERAIENVQPLAETLWGNIVALNKSEG